MNIPKIRCNKRCDGCPALALQKEQYVAIVKDLSAGVRVEDSELLRKFLNMEVLVVFCTERQSTCLWDIKNRGSAT